MSGDTYEDKKRMLNTIKEVLTAISKEINEIDLQQKNNKADFMLAWKRLREATDARLIKLKSLFGTLDPNHKELVDGLKAKLSGLEGLIRENVQDKNGLSVAVEKLTKNMQAIKDSFTSLERLIAEGESLGIGSSSSNRANKLGIKNFRKGGSKL